MSQFSEQGFVHDLAGFNWEKILLIPDMEFGWKYFYKGLTTIINRHANLKKYCVNNLWFSPTLSNLIHDCDVA